MSNDQKAPTRYNPGSLPSLGIPSATPGLSSALVQHMRNRVADMMYGRLNSVAEKRVQLEENATRLVDLATQRKRLLGTFDDLDNILAFDHDERNNERANGRDRHANDAINRDVNGIKRKTAVELAEIEARNALARARGENQSLSKQSGTSEQDPEDSPIRRQLRQRMAAYKVLVEMIAEWRQYIETSPDIPASERAAEIARAEAVLRAEFEKQYGVGGSAGDDANFNRA